MPKEVATTNSSMMQNLGQRLNSKDNLVLLKVKNLMKLSRSTLLVNSWKGEQKSNRPVPTRMCSGAFFLLANCLGRKAQPTVGGAYSGRPSPLWAVPRQEGPAHCGRCHS